MPDLMHLVVGLGNPGRSYCAQRHNIGFMLIDRLFDAHIAGSGGQWRHKFHSETASGAIGAMKCLLLKPRTFMNRSGLALGEAQKFFKVPPQNIIVAHDELDLAPGRVRVKQGGGHGGHNGVRSIMEAIGPDFTRLRLGIGHPGDKRQVDGHVLGDFLPHEESGRDAVLNAIVCDFDLLMAGQTGNFLNRLHVSLAAHQMPGQARQAPHSQADGARRAGGDAQGGRHGGRMTGH